MAGAPSTMVRKSPEIAMNPRALVKTPYSTRDPDPRPAAATYHLPQVRNYCETVNLTKSRGDVGVTGRVIPVETHTPSL